MQKQTTGRLISELGVRTVLALNMVTENHLDDGERAEHLARVAEIMDGLAGVGASRVQIRSVERCAMGMWN